MTDITGVEVPRVSTPLGILEMAAILRDAHHFVFGDFPTQNRLGGAWSHNALETGQGKALWNYNFGNVSAFKPWAGDYYVIRVQEQTDPTNPDPKKRWKEVNMPFRSHNTFIDGARDYWWQMKGRYVSAIPYFDTGNMRAACAALKSKIYFTADLEPYAEAVASLYKYTWPKVWPSL